MSASGRKASEPEILLAAQDISGLTVTSSGRIIYVQAATLLYELKPDGKTVHFAGSQVGGWKNIDGPGQKAAFGLYITSLLPTVDDGLIVTDAYALRHIDGKGNVTTIRYFNPAPAVTTKTNAPRQKAANDLAAAPATKISASATALGPDGLIYCVDAKKQAVFQVDIEGKTRLYSKLSTNKSDAPVILNYPSMAVDVKSNVYVIGKPYGIYKMPPSGGELTLIYALDDLDSLKPEYQFAQDPKFSIDSEGRFWLTSFATMVVLRADKKVFPLNKGIANPDSWFRGENLCFDRTGNLYTYNHAYILKYSADHWRKHLEKP